MEKYLEIGKIQSVHGLKGEINVSPWCDTPKDMCGYKKFYSADGSKVYEVERVRPNGENVILKLKGTDSPEAAQTLRGTVLYIDRSDAHLPKGSYFIADLIGLEVVSETGEVLGQLTDVLRTGANDVYEISKGTQKYYIPAVPTVVLNTDIECGKMTVFKMEGLFDEN